MLLRTLFALALLACPALAAPQRPVADLARAFQATKKPAEAHAARLTALEATASIDTAALVDALLDAYVQLEDEALPQIERRRPYLLRGQREKSLEDRGALDPLHDLQDRIRARLLALESDESLERLVRAGLTGKKLPLTLRIALAARAGDQGRDALAAVGAAWKKARKPETQSICLQALESLGARGAEHAGRVVRLLESDARVVRMEAADALARLASPAAIEPLVARLDEEHGRDRARVAAALQVLTGQRIGQSSESWRRWLEREGAAHLAGRVALSEGEPLEAAHTGGSYHGLPLDGRSIVFVYDVSKSMRRTLDKPSRIAEDGEPSRLSRAEEELVRALGQLREDVTFNVIAFDAVSRRFAEDVVRATPRNVAAAQAWVRARELALGTGVYDALELAFAGAGRGAQDAFFDARVDTLFVLTDGRPIVKGKADSRERILGAVRRWNLLDQVVVNVIGLGDEVPKGFLRELAEQNGGKLVLELDEGQPQPKKKEREEQHAVSTPPGRPPDPERPNVVLFLVDDLGWRDVGFMGSRFYDTPHMDRLAAEGMVFTQAYANAPNCAPSRACLMSGQYTPRHGVYTVGSPARGKSIDRKLIPSPNRTDLDPGVVTLAEALGARGYTSAHVGKWHLGPDPRTQGFDVNVGGNASGSPRGGYFSPYRNPDLADGPDGEYLTDRLTDEALAFLDAHAGEPFFLHFAHYSVHTPIQAKEEHLAKYEGRDPQGGQGNAKYAAMVASTDESLGRVLAKLAELGVAENTLVILFSDNGGYGPATSMQPLRGSKGMLYEGGVREPLVVRWPARVAPGRCDVPVMGVDFYPTLLTACGAPRPAQPLDGVDLAPLLAGGTELARAALFWHFPAYLQGYRKDQVWRTTPAGSVRRGDLKLIEFFEDGRRELYDLAADPGETRDLAQARPADARALAQLLEEWREQLDAPVPRDSNPDYVAPADR